MRTILMAAAIHRTISQRVTRSILPQDDDDAANPFYRLARFMLCQSPHPLLPRSDPKVSSAVPAPRGSRRDDSSMRWVVESMY